MTCHADLQKLQAQRVTVPNVRTTTVPTKKAATKGATRKKRRANEITSDDNVFQTPDKTADRPNRPLKKRGFDPALAVEKSTFSITPFLNKTINFTDISPKSGGDNTTKTLPVFQFRGGEDSSTSVNTTGKSESTTADVQEAPKAPAPPVRAKLQEKKARGRPRKVLAEAPVSKKNLSAKNSRKAPRVESTLEKVMEEDDEPSQDQENRSTESTASSKQNSVFQVKPPEARLSGSSSIASTEPEPKKKKRKVLSSSNKPTLFDEDDGEQEVVKRPVKALAASRGLGKMPMGKVKNAFAGASFSPLKRDRRGVNASFLS